MKIFSNDQVVYIRSLGFSKNFDELTNDDWCDLEDLVADRLAYAGFDVNYNPTKEGLMCESILDRLSELP